VAKKQKVRNDWEPGKSASVVCGSCSGSGMRALSKRRLDEWRRRIEASENALELREQLRRESNCGECGGSGWACVATDAPKDPDWFNSSRCSVCRGSGEVPNEDLQDVCQRCAGEGYEIPITAWPTGSSKGGRQPAGSVSFDGAEEFGSAGTAFAASKKTAEDEREDAAYLAELERKARAIDLVRERDPAVAEALVAYHGAEGEKWAPTRWGRLFALWPLTVAGGTLVEEFRVSSKLGSGYLMDPCAILASVRIAELESDVPNFRQRALLRDADVEARMLSARCESESKAVAL